MTEDERRDDADELRALALAMRRTPSKCACCPTPVLRGQEFCPSCRLLRAAAKYATAECLERALEDKRAGRL